MAVVFILYIDVGFFCFVVLRQKDKTTMKPKLAKNGYELQKKKNIRHSSFTQRLKDDKKKKIQQTRRRHWLPSNYLPLHCVILYISLLDFFLSACADQ